ncbi:MAG: hypothetical protein QOI29_2612 [Mycobacterium sp.]|jgi:hypothetical protein|nr:hypothetical protein [Mycobacterium sp.]
MGLGKKVVAELKRVVGTDHVRAGSGDIEPYARDATPLFRGIPWTEPRHRRPVGLNMSAGHQRSREVVMARYLVVAHETVTNPELLDQLRAIQKDDQQAEFVLLVPATPVRHLLRRGDEHDAEVVAGKRADRARSMFKRRGVHLAGTRVGAASPADAVDDELRDNPGYAGVVISTLPKEKSRWLRMDLPRAVESRHNLPVYHVQAPEEWTVGDLP